MTEFAKIFESKVHGQILVKMDRGNDGEPQVKVYMKPQGFGVCAHAASFIEEDNGWGKAQKLFDMITLDKAEVFLAPVIAAIKSEVNG